MNELSELFCFGNAAQTTYSNLFALLSGNEDS